MPKLNLITGMLCFALKPLAQTSIRTSLALALVSTVFLGTLLVTTAQAQTPPPNDEQTSSSEGEEPPLPTPTPIPQDGSQGADSGGVQGAGASDPTITITRYRSPVTEGGTVYFRFTASSAPSAHVEINLRATGGSSFLTATPVKSIGLGPGLTVAWLILGTEDDNVDEPNGTITTRILSGTGYNVGSPSSATITILDNDLANSPSIDISGLVTSMQEGGSDSFTVRASNLVSSQSYTIQVTTSNSDIGFNSTCSDRQEDVTVPTRRTSYSRTFTLRGCDTSGGTVTASLRRGSTTLDTDSQSVTVTPPPPSIDISGLVTSMQEGGSDSFTVRASNLVSSQSYTVRVTTSNSDIGFNSTCSDRQEDVTVPSRRTSYSRTFTLRGCDTSGGTVTASLRRGSTTVDTDSQSVTVTPPPPSIEISGLVTTMEEGDSDSFTVSVSNLVSSQSYTIQVTTSNSDIGFNSSCSTGTRSASVSRRTSHTASYTLYGCETTGGTVTASLRRGSTTVDTDSQSVKVTTPANGAPDFTKNAYSFSVREDAAKGASIDTVSAPDPDTGDTVEYFITSSSPEFAIGLHTGVITVEVALDHETKRLYTLSVEARDGNGGVDTATVTIVVSDVNEVSIAGPAVPSREGEDMVFTVSADSAVLSDTTITFNIENSSTAAYPSDYRFDFEDDSKPWTLTILRGNRTGSIEIKTKDGDVDEAYETVVLSLTAVSGDVAVVNGDTTKVTAQGVIADQIEVDAIVDNATSTIEIDMEDEPSSRIEFKLKTARGTFDNPFKKDYDRRAYVIKVEAREVGKADWTPARIIDTHTGTGEVRGYTGDLEDYVEFGDGQAVWVEKTAPSHRYVLLEAAKPSSFVGDIAKYRITISKPDLAIVAHSVAPMPTAPASTGTINSTVTMRNSSKKDNLEEEDRAYIIVVRCEGTAGSSNRSYPLTLLRSGNADFLTSKSNGDLSLGTVCEGTSPTRSDQITSVTVKLYSEEKKLPDQVVPVTPAQTAWPFAVTDTLWRKQSEMMGGLQLMMDKPSSQYWGLCTSSFSLKMTPLTTATVAANGHSRTPFEAMSTTGHCQEDMGTWYQGSLTSAAARSDVGMTLMTPATTTCGIIVPDNEGDDDGEKDKGDEDDEPDLKIQGDCHVGDQTYSKAAPPVPMGLTYTPTTIFKPGTQSPSTLAALLAPRIEYFVADAVGGSTVRFKIVGARPPEEGDVVHKVGRTTGWTSGEIRDYEDDKDDQCPGSQVGAGDNKTREGYHLECLVRAEYTSRGGDSGAPVFVKTDNPTTDDVEVILVGVHFGGSDTTGGTGSFVPVDRVYAESLRQGYDWDTNGLRPVPALEGNRETLSVQDNGPTIKATFDELDFSQGSGLQYVAVLYRTSGGVPEQVRDVEGNTYSREVSRDTPGPIAEFDGERIPADKRSGTFSVRVSVCAYDISLNPRVYHCGSYGTDGGKSVTPVPAPGTPTVSLRSDGKVRVSWKTVASTNEYKLGYRLASSNGAWTEAGGDKLTTTAANVSGLTCGTDKSYEFRVRAHADTSAANNPYDGGWGFWSGPSASLVVTCQGSGGTAEAEVTATEVDDSGSTAAPPPERLAASASGRNTVELTWQPVNGSSRYRVEYSPSGADQWTTAIDSLSETRWTVPQLACGTSYDFRVSAHGDGATYTADWGAPSITASTTTEECNRPPEFSHSSYSFSILESAAVGTVVGEVSATDPDEDDTVAYSIQSGDEDGKFDLIANATSTRIVTASPLDYETAASYTLTVQVSDGNGGTATTSVSVAVVDVAETPAPAPLNLGASIEDDTFSLTWTAVTGAIKYEARYRVKEADGEWAGEATTEGTSVAFRTEGGPACGTTYEFRVRAFGDGKAFAAEWGTSAAVFLRMGACNTIPEFADASYAFSVGEDASLGYLIGKVVATDPDEGDTVTYWFGGGNEDGKFGIEAKTGQITVAGTLDYETTATYTLTVEAIDASGGTATTSVAVTVTDVIETPPPAPQNLSATSTSDSVTLTWDAPSDPTITGYQILRRKQGEEKLQVHVADTGNTGASYVDTSVDQNTTYFYRVKAINDVGVGKRSNSVRVKTGQSP